MDVLPLEMPFTVVCVTAPVQGYLPLADSLLNLLSHFVVSKAGCVLYKRAKDCMGCSVYMSHELGIFGPVFWLLVKVTSLLFNFFLFKV